MKLMTDPNGQKIDQLTKMTMMVIEGRTTRLDNEPFNYWTIDGRTDEENEN